MYLEFYGLQEAPFGLTPNPRHLFKTESHIEALAMLQYGIAENKGLIVLTGEAGTGKTTILRLALKECSADVLPIYLFNPFLTAAEFFQQITHEFKLGLERTATKPEALTALGRFLIARHTQGLKTVLLIDEAHGLPPELLEEARLLLNFETSEEKLLQIILCGQPELDDLLNTPRLRQLKQRVSLRCYLKPLSVFDINKYIRFRLKSAGATNVNLFDQAAVGLIGHLSQGVPRIINNLCDNALLYGFAAGRALITREIIEDVSDALDMRPAEPPAYCAADFIEDDLR